MNLQNIKISEDYYIIDGTAHTRRAKAQETLYTKKGGYRVIFYIYSQGSCEKIPLKNIIREAD